MSTKVLILVLFVVVVSTAAASVREWKNFENGKVYSHKKPLNNKREEKTEEPTVASVPEERMLHSHHRDKMRRQMRSNRLVKNSAQENHLPQTEQPKSKNFERHHKKSVEEEMHLRPLNERHHKFPNPALLNTVGDEKSSSPQISKQKLIKQVKSRNKTNGKRMFKGRRYKRNRTDEIKHTFSTANTTTKPTLLKPHDTKSTLKEGSLGKIRKLRELRNDYFLPKLPYMW